MITQPYVNFILPDAGGNVKPISNGTIYIGKEGLDPKLGGNPIYYRDNEGTEVEISSPLYLNMTGVIVDGPNSSNIINPYTKAPISILIENKNGNPVWEELSNVSQFATEQYINAKNIAVTPEDFGASVGVDSTTEVIAWLKSGKPLHLDKSYTISTIDEIISDIVTVPSQGELVSSENSADAPIVKITGNNNKIKHGFNIRHTGDMRSFLSLIWLEGNKNRIEGCDTSCDVKHLPSQGEQYIKAGIVLIGDSNSAVKNTGENVGTAIIEDGRYNWIQGNNYNVICAGYKMQSKSRYAQILGNVVVGDPSVTLQGCDGIWGERSHRFSTISGNVAKNMGEHGVYLQGDSFTYDKSNWVEGCHGAVIKVGAKTDGNFAYPGETLPTFDEFGQPSTELGSVYATCNATIEPRGKNCRLGGGTDGCISIQTNVAELKIVNYNISDCPDSPNAIRTLYLENEPEENQTVMANINVLGGRTRRSGDVNLAGRSGMVIDGLNTDGDVTIFCKTGKTNISPEINTRRARIIVLSRTENPVLTSCNAVAVNEATCTDAELYDCRLSDQSQGGDWSTGRVKFINGGKITWLGTESFNINGIQDCTNVEFNFPNANTSYPLTYNFGQGGPVQGSFNDNIINAPLSERPVRVGGNYSTVNSNVVNGSSNSTYSLTIQGDQVTAVGNAMRYGQLRLESTATNCFVVGPNVSNGNAGGNNIVVSS